MEVKTLGPKKSLSYLTGINRPIRPDHVTKLAASIDAMGNIRPIVVAWISFLTGKLTPYIIDGQHLFNALLRNGLPIEYVEITVKDTRDLVEKIALLNSSSKSWALVDYILAWSVVVPDYKKLFQYYNIYDFELSILAAVLNGKNVSAGHQGGGIMTKSIKKGDFRIVDETKAIAILDDLTDILKIIPRMNRQENKYVSNEYVIFRRLATKYDHKKFLTNLASNKQKFILATQQPEKLSEMFKKLSA